MISMGVDVLNHAEKMIKQSMYFTEKVVVYSDVCYKNAMSYTI